MRLFAICAAIVLALAAPVQAQPRFHDESRLPAPVREAVVAARDAESRAEAAASIARDAAARADDAVQRARRGEQGFRLHDGANVSNHFFHYEGGWRGDGKDGYGSTVFMSGPFLGDRYRGAYANDQYNGYGAYHWGENDNNDAQQLRFEGQFAGDAANGVGVRTYRDGRTRAGEVREWLSNGHLVFNFPDGRRYEGQVAAGQYDGYGVLWNPDGSIAQAGRWARGELAR